MWCGKARGIAERSWGDSGGLAAGVLLGVALGGDLLADQDSSSGQLTVWVLLRWGGAGDNAARAGTGHRPQQGSHRPGGGRVDSDVANADG